MKNSGSPRIKKPARGKTVDEPKSRKRERSTGNEISKKEEVKPKSRKTKHDVFQIMKRNRESPKRSVFLFFSSLGVSSFLVFAVFPVVFSRGLPEFFQFFSFCSFPSFLVFVSFSSFLVFPERRKGLGPERGLGPPGVASFSFCVFLSFSLYLLFADFPHFPSILQHMHVRGSAHSGDIRCQNCKAAL